MSLQTWAHWTACVTVAPLACVVSAALVRAVVHRTRPGLQRLLLCTPAVALYSAVPFLFDVQSVSRASAAAILLWLANFKLLALCLGRGPLTQPDLSLGQFTALLLWPIIPKTDAEGRVVTVSDGRVRASRALQRVLWRVPENLVIAVAGLFTLTHPWVPLFAKTYSAAFGVCCYCDLWANACAALVIWLQGLDVGPSWDRPWLQTSLADFWGRRWNLPASSSLKYLVYEPLVQRRLVAASGPRERTRGSPEADRAPHQSSDDSATAKTPVGGEADGVGSKAPPPCPDMGPTGLAPAGPVTGPDDAAAGEFNNLRAEDEGRHGAKAGGGGSSIGGAPEPTHGSAGASAGARRSRGSSSALLRLAGLSATFAVSGLMHELLLCVCTGDASHLGKQALFFAIQAPLMAVEQRLVKALLRARIHLPTWLCIPVASLTLQIPAKYWFWGAYFAAVRPRSSPLAPTPAAVAASAAAGHGLVSGIATDPFPGLLGNISWPHPEL